MLYLQTVFPLHQLFPAHLQVCLGHHLPSLALFTSVYYGRYRDITPSNVCSLPRVLSVFGKLNTYTSCCDESQTTPRDFVVAVFLFQQFIFNHLHFLTCKEASLSGWDIRVGVLICILKIKELQFF